MATLSIEMNAPAKPSLRAESRNAGIDALRASLTLLVLFHHSAVTYGAMGSWFYQEIEPSHAPSSLILTLFAAYNQAFFMGLFFLIAGSLTPGAIARHGAAQYLRERLIRLGAPAPHFHSRAGTVHGGAGADRERPCFFRDAWPAREARSNHFRTDVVRLGAPDLRRRLSRAARRNRRRAARKGAAVSVERGSRRVRARDRRRRVSAAVALADGRGGDRTPDRLFRELRRPVRRGLPRRQGALARKRAGQPIGQLAQDLHHRRLSAACSADRRLVIVRPREDRRTGAGTSLPSSMHFGSPSSLGA